LGGGLERKEGILDVTVFLISSSFRSQLLGRWKTLQKSHPCDPQALALSPTRHGKVVRNIAAEFRVGFLPRPHDAGLGVLRCQRARTDGRGAGLAGLRDPGLHGE